MSREPHAGETIDVSRTDAISSLRAGGGARQNRPAGATADRLVAIEIHTHTLELQAERVLASIEGLAFGSAYMADLDGEIEATDSAYVVAGVTEMATLRAELSGQQVG